MKKAKKKNKKITVSDTNSEELIWFSFSVTFPAIDRFSFGRLEGHFAFRATF